jgi:hypothetical protein
LNPAERLVLILALLPHLKPEILTGLCSNAECQAHFLFRLNGPVALYGADRLDAASRRRGGSYLVCPWPCSPPKGVETHVLPSETVRRSIMLEMVLEGKA